MIYEGNLYTIINLLIFYFLLLKEDFLDHNWVNSVLYFYLHEPVQQVGAFSEL